MCDFKPGDDVVCVQVDKRNLLTIGRIYTVACMRMCIDGPGVVVVGIDPFPDAFAPHRFRKVQRRDLSEWLKTSIGNTDKLDKRQKTKA